MKRKTLLIIFGVSTLTVAVSLPAVFLLGASSDARAETIGTESSLGERIRADALEIQPVNVKTAEVERDSLVEVVRSHGVTAPNKDVTFSAEVPGRVETLGPDLGDRVKRGQLLARIDFKTLAAENRQAEAAYDLARNTLMRLQSLGADLVTTQKLDEAESRMIGARASLEITKANVKKSTVRSNLNGVVSAKYAEPAEYVGPGKPLYQIVDYSTVVIEAQLPETQVALVNKGANAKVTIDALGETFEGTVEAVLPAADPVARTFTARVRLDNQDLRILVGMSASCEIASRVFENVVVIPQDKVLEGPDGRSVFVDDNGTARKRSVVLGARQEDRVVVLEGLSPGENLIVVGHRDLADGQPVEAER